MNSVHQLLDIFPSVNKAYEQLQDSFLLDDIDTDNRYDDQLLAFVIGWLMAKGNSVEVIRSRLLPDDDYDDEESD